MVCAQRLPSISRWEIVTRLRNWPGGFNSVAVQSFASQAQDARVHSVEAQGQDLKKAVDDQESDEHKQGGQMAWLTDLLEPAMKLYRRALPADKDSEPTNTASLVDIASSILRSTSGMQMQKWSIADLTLGLYFLSIRHASQMAGDSFRGDPVTSDEIVGDLIYYVELARGSYQKDAAGLARISMIQESKVVKFEDKSSVMRPGYYIAVDHRHKLVILCIRGTHTVHDIITDLASNSEDASTLDGESVHYGSIEAARWLMQNEVATLKKCLQENTGYELRLVGHSLGGSTAALLALMLREGNGSRDLGISPELIKAVIIASPPCVSRKLSRKCSHYITTLVLQDDVIPRMNTAALTRLRNEILLTDWTMLKESKDHRGLVELVESTIQKFSTVQDVARRISSYVSLNTPTIDADESEKVEEDVEKVAKKLLDKEARNPKPTTTPAAQEKRVDLAKQTTSTPTNEHPELCVPGTLLLVAGGRVPKGGEDKSVGREGHVLLKGQEGTQFGRIVLSSTMLSDHKCVSIYHGLRDVLKGLPKSRGSDKLSI